MRYDLFERNSKGLFSIETTPKSGYRYSRKAFAVEETDMSKAPWLAIVLFSFPVFLCHSETHVLPSSASVEGGEEVSPVEYLMREHGVLRRILLIYEELIKRLATNTSFAPKLLKDSALIVQNFIENYHEKLEEDYLFPKLEKREEMKEIVRLLLEQHKRGRLLTSYILDHASSSDIQDKEKNARIRKYLEEFITMYRPHAAREDTVVFPYFKTLISEHDYLFLGDVFENKETSLFGTEGFSKIVNDVASIEKALGLYSLERYTPPAPKDM